MITFKSVNDKGETKHWTYDDYKILRHMWYSGSRSDCPGSGDCIYYVTVDEEGIDRPLMQTSLACHGSETAYFEDLIVYFATLFNDKEVLDNLEAWRISFTALFEDEYEQWTYYNLSEFKDDYKAQKGMPSDKAPIIKVEINGILMDKVIMASIMGVAPEMIQNVDLCFRDLLSYLGWELMDGMDIKNPAADKNILCGFVWCHGRKDFSFWETDSLSMEDRAAIEAILSKYEAEGSSERRCWDRRICDMMIEEY